MSRTRIRRKSKRAKKWKDKMLLAEFAETFAVDAVEKHLDAVRTESGKRCPLWGRHKMTWNLPERFAICHIWHNGKREDRWGNLVRATERAHSFTHRYPIIGAIVLMWCRVQGCDAEERAEIEDDWNEAAGFKVLAWVQGKRDSGDVPTQYLGFVDDLLEMF